MGEREIHEFMMRSNRNHSSSDCVVAYIQLLGHLREVLSVVRAVLWRKEINFTLLLHKNDDDYLTLTLKFLCSAFDFHSEMFEIKVYDFFSLVFSSITDLPPSICSRAKKYLFFNIKFKFIVCRWGNLSALLRFVSCDDFVFFSFSVGEEFFHTTLTSSYYKVLSFGNETRWKVFFFLYEKAEKLEKRRQFIRISSAGLKLYCRGGDNDVGWQFFGIFFHNLRLNFRKSCTIS